MLPAFALLLGHWGEGMTACANVFVVLVVAAAVAAIVAVVAVVVVVVVVGEAVVGSNYMFAIIVGNGIY